MTTAGSRGRELVPSGNGRGAGLREKGRRAARRPAGSAGRGAGLSEEVTDPGGRGGDGPLAAGLAVFTSPRESPLPRSGLN